MDKRSMMNRYYDDVEMHAAEVALKYGIQDGTIKLAGDEISGDTYRARLAIKNYFGARWNGVKKCWTITKEIDFAKNIFANGLAV